MKPLDINTIQRSISGIRDLEPLAQGGQKSVFHAMHDDYGEVVLKVILQPNERIQREIDIAKTCNIPHTARLYDWGGIEHDGNTVIYIVEECIKGVNLREALKTQGRMPTKQALKLMSMLLDTAVAMEKKKLVHRDIKPENIMVCPDGEFKLLDFGIARQITKSSLTPTDAHFGPHTAGYGAPEQFRNLKQEIDIRTDLFAIGVVIYEVFTGRHPFAADSRDQLETLRRTEKVIPPPLVIDVDKDGKLSALISVLMAKFPSRRPPTATRAQEWFDSICSVIDNNTGD